MPCVYRMARAKSVPIQTGEVTMPTRSVRDIDCQGKRVLIRVDFNVPLDDTGAILDDRRIAAALPTIQYVLKGGGIAVVMSHFGRPAGTGFEREYTLAPVAERLQSLLGDKHPVHFVSGACVGDAVTAAVSSASPGEVVLLDNLRFEPGEKSNDASFGAAVALLGDAYVNDAFGTSHRAHASMVAVPQAMSRAPRVAGLLLEKELHFLSDTLADPKRPFAAILGGAKVSDKLATIENLLPRVDAIFVGGAMAYTFLRAAGESIGESLLEEDMVPTARLLLEESANSSTEIVLPTDHQCAERIEANAKVRICELGIPKGWMGLDIGPETEAAWRGRLLNMKTVIWNGPVGVFEQPPFDHGTIGIAKTLAQATHKHHAVTVIGGGETAAAVRAAGVADRLSHVSTGGGASLRMLEGADLSGLDALETI
jgi:phosphoglycerate kinase